MAWLIPHFTGKPVAGALWLIGAPMIASGAPSDHPSVPDGGVTVGLLGLGLLGLWLVSRKFNKRR